MSGPGDPSTHPAREKDSSPLLWGDRKKNRALQSQSKRRFGFGFFRGLWSWMIKLSRSLGLSRSRERFDHVVYRACTNMSLRRSLSESGPGVKEYDAFFDHPGSDLRSSQYPYRKQVKVRCTKSRIYSDLSPDPRSWFVDQLIEYVHPGTRVLEIGCGTGVGSAKLSELVGPAGGVVSIHRDGESIRFARQRWRMNHLGFEIGWLETLEGELEGGFESVIAFNLLREADDDPQRSRAVGQLYRVVAEGGLIGVMCQDPVQLNQIVVRLQASGIERLTKLAPDPMTRWWGAYGWKTGESSKQTRTNP